MTAQANVITSAGNVKWYTDKCEIVTGNTAITYQINAQIPSRRVGINGQVTNGSNVMITTQATPELIGAVINTGDGFLANSVTVSAVVIGQSLTLSGNATASTSTGPYTLTLGNTYGNMYSSPVQVAANNRQQIYVGAGNYLLISGSNFTARELGSPVAETYFV